MKKSQSLLWLIGAATAMSGMAQSVVPTGLSTELLTDTRTVWQGGYATSAQLTDVQTAMQRAKAQGLTTIPYQVAAIRTAHPMLGWTLEGTGAQSAYRIWVATQPELLAEGKADVWDSGKRQGAACTGISMEGQPLQPNSLYYWTVEVWNQAGVSSQTQEPSAFLTADTLDDAIARYPLVKTDDRPVAQSDQGMYSFERAAFGQLRITVEAEQADTLTIRLGEATRDGRVDDKPGGTIRYKQLQMPVHAGRATYQLMLPPDGRNAMIKPHGQDVRPVLMPDYVGEVYPFRYCEIEPRHGAKVQEVSRQAVHYHWDENGAWFRSPDSVLNQVWDLCRYTIKATSFCGVYVDGDRERIPYEADALINQLSHYCTDQDYSMARYTVDYLCKNATWPTEWILQALIMSYNDYLYPGDTALIARDYDIRKARTLDALIQPNGLMSTRVGRQPEQLLRACGYYGKQINDIVDWPQSGAFGMGKEEAGEADGYQHKTYNTVVNAFHYEALVLMSRIASALGRKEDASLYATKAEGVKKAINTLLYDAEKGCYLDGLETDHHSLHANMMPLAFGIVPAERRASVLDFVRSRGMACSVYGAQFLLDALYEAGDADYALQLLTDRGSRGWYNMLQVGSTMTLEAWDLRYKPNLDWNHAWGSAPANIIPRRLMGVMPLEPGWSRMQIKPQLGTLPWAEAKVPTVRGAVQVSARQSDGQYELEFGVPAGVEAEVSVPVGATKRYKATLDGGKCRTRLVDGRVTLTVTGGQHKLVVKKQ